MANPAPGFKSSPDHRVDLVPESRRVRVVLGGATIADSTAALRVEETGHDPVHYIPEKDVRVALLHRTDHHSRCPYKGDASYWTIEVPECGGVRIGSACGRVVLPALPARCTRFHHVHG